MENQLQDTNLSALAERINSLHSEAQGAAILALNKAMDAGDCLVEAKSQLQHGQWGTWLKDNFHGSDRTARAYMQLANNRQLIECKMAGSAVLTIDQALKSITQYDALQLPQWDANTRYWGFVETDDDKLCIEVCPARSDDYFWVGVYHHLLPDYRTQPGYVDYFKRAIPTWFIPEWLNRSGVSRVDDWSETPFDGTQPCFMDPC